VVAGVSTLAGSPLVGAEDGWIGEIVTGEGACGFCGCWTVPGKVWANPRDSTTADNPIIPMTAT
jgi:hypothetical protein